MNGLVGQLAAACRKLPSLGVYRSVDGLNALIGNWVALIGYLIALMGELIHDFARFAVATWENRLGLTPRIGSKLGIRDVLRSPLFQLPVIAANYWFLRISNCLKLFLWWVGISNAANKQTDWYQTISNPSDFTEYRKPFCRDFVTWPTTASVNWWS